MAVGITAVDVEKMLELTGGNIVYLNDLNPATDRELIDRLTLTQYDKTSFSMIPMCSCGATSLVSHPHLTIGDTCEYCHTEIHTQTSRKLESVVWIKPPEGIPYLVLPIFLAMLIDTYRIANTQISIVNWLLDPWDKTFDRKDKNKLKQIEYMESVGIKQGLSYFVNNLDYIMEHLNNDDIFDKKREKRGQLYHYYLRHKDKILVKHLPLPDKSFNVIENSPLGSYVDLKSFTPFANLINMITGLNNLKRPPSMARKDSIMGKVLIGLAQYYVNYIRSSLNVKKGDFRQHVYGSRMTWTARSVITSIQGAHDMMEVHLPWKIAIPLFEIHLSNLLMKQGMNPNQIQRRLYHAVNNYDPEIHELLNQLIKESPHRTPLTKEPGFMMIINRNPSLKMASIECLYITKIKPDINDITTSISVMILAGMNGDFDGDENNLMLILDMFGAASIINLSSVNNILSHGYPNKLSGDVGVSKQIYAIIGSWAEEYLGEQ